MGTRPSETKAWRALQAHHAQVKDVHLRDVFAKAAPRSRRVHERAHPALPEAAGQALSGVVNGLQ